MDLLRAKPHAMLTPHISARWARRPHARLWKKASARSQIPGHYRTPWMDALPRHKPTPMRTRMIVCHREEARIAMKAETWPGKEQYQDWKHKVETHEMD